MQTKDHPGTCRSGGAGREQPSGAVGTGEGETLEERPMDPTHPVSMALIPEHTNRGMAEQQAPNSCSVEHPSTVAPWDCGILGLWHTWLRRACSKKPTHQESN